MEKKKIRIPLSQSDLEELMSGESFDWTFDGIDVHLFNEEEGEGEEYE